MEECAKKLEQTIKDIPLSDIQVHRSQVFYSTRKTSKQQSFLERYLGKSERKSTRKPSAIKLKITSVANKENKPSRCTKKLFGDENTRIDTNVVKRESLGLLPEICFEDDNVMSGDIMQDIELNSPMVKGITVIPDDVFNFQPPKHTMERIYRNKGICEELSKLLHSHNRQIVWNLFKNRNELLHLSIVKNLVFDQQTNTG